MKSYRGFPLNHLWTKEKAAFNCDNIIILDNTGLLDAIFHYSQGLQRSRTVFIMQRLILLCLYTVGVSFAFFLPVFEFSLDYVIIWQPHIWLRCLRYLHCHSRQEKAKCSRIAVSICFLSAGCQQGKWSPYKWCFSLSHLIVAGLCAVDETQKVITIRSSN